MTSLWLSSYFPKQGSCLWEWLLAQTELQPAFGSLLTGTSQKTDSDLTMDDCGMRLLFVSINVASWPAGSSLSSPLRSLAFPSQHFTSYQLIHGGVWVRIPGIPAPLSWLLLRWKEKSICVGNKPYAGCLQEFCLLNFRSLLVHVGCRRFFKCLLVYQMLTGFQEDGKKLFCVVFVFSFSSSSIQEWERKVRNL